jgi:phosphatidylinositol alpha-1,6-mannosyltransferase
VLYVYGSETIRFGNRKFVHWLLRKLTQEANLVVVNSEFTKSEYLKFGVPGVKLIKITPGVDTQVFRPGEKDQALLRRFNLNGEKILLTVSRLDERKGHLRVIESMPTLLRKYPNIKYLIVGSGREEQRLKNLVNKLKLDDNVVFVGAVDEHELPEFYRLCDIFVLANSETQNDNKLKGDYEGFGIVFLEASASGKPVIGGLSGGVEDAVVPGKTGYLIPPKSTKNLISSISDLIGEPHKAEYMGKQGRIRTLREFDWHIIARKMERILC